jgi:type IV pilus assembly protein PilB
VIGRLTRSRTRDEVAPGVPAEPVTPDLEVHAGGQRLGELLVQRRHVTAAQLGEALLQQSASGERIGRLLVGLGVLDERDLAAVVSEQLNLPLADLGRTAPQEEAFALLSETTARTYAAIPVLLDGDEVVIAVADPSDDLRDRLARECGRPVVLVVGVPSEVRRAIDNSYRALTAVSLQVEAFQAAESLRKPSAQANGTAATDDAPVVRIVNLLITQALRDRASDVHIEPQDQRIRIRFRVDGALHDVLALPDGIGPGLVSRLKIMAGMNIVERRRPQDGQIGMDVDGRAVDIRVSTTGTIWGEKVVLRILDKSRPLYRLNDLGMPVDTHEAFSKLVRAPFGMVLCAGPTGSGKTTTLYATMSEINESQRNIMTIEDPVEYVFPSINQIQMNEQAGLSFATGLKSILRQDPDVILVGEIRDVDTARIATQAALTGHFVLSSLHATDAVAALHRFLDMGIESFLIASSVLAVVGQRLVRRICESCTAPYKPTPEELDFYAASGGAPKKHFLAGTGCNLCAGTGYSDRIGVFELLPITPEIRRLVVGWATQDELRRLAVKQGMRTLRDEAVALVTQDRTTIAEVVRNIYTA